MLTLCDLVDCSLQGSSVHGIFPCKNTGVGCRFLLQGNLPNPGIELGSPAWQADSLPAEPPGNSMCLLASSVEPSSHLAGNQPTGLYYPLCFFLQEPTCLCFNNCLSIVSRHLQTVTVLIPLFQFGFLLLLFLL